MEIVMCLAIWAIVIVALGFMWRGVLCTFRDWALRKEIRSLHKNLNLKTNDRP